MFVVYLLCGMTLSTRETMGISKHPKRYQWMMHFPAFRGGPLVFFLPRYDYVTVDYLLSWGHTSIGTNRFTYLIVDQRIDNRKNDYFYILPFFYNTLYTLLALYTRETLV